MKKKIFICLACFCLILTPFFLTGCFGANEKISINNESDLIQCIQKDFLADNSYYSHFEGERVYETKYYELNSNITVKKTNIKNASTIYYNDWVPSRETEEEFMENAGWYKKYIVLDGQNHTVKNLSLSGFGASVFGMIGSESRITVKNITFDNLTINGSGPVGAIMSLAVGENIKINFENVHIINSSITTDDNYPVGGFIGITDNVTGIIKKCSIKNSTINGVNAEACGGFIGSNTITVRGDLLKVSNCESKNNTISAKINAGGIYGKFAQTYGDYQTDRLIEFKNLTNSSSVTATEGFVGGIVGYLHYWDYGNFVFENCHNKNDENTSRKINTEEDHAGGILGAAYWVGSGLRVPDGSQINFNNCTNNMSISANSHVGGISGFLSTRFWKATYTNCKNLSDGNIYGVNNIGGIAGTIDGNIIGAKQFTFTNCENNGFITGKGEYVGGISGKNLSLTPLYTNCTNSSQSNWLTGKKYVGGIAGRYGIFVNCTNAMDIKHNGPVQITWEYVGGIVGSGELSKFTNCSNSGNIIDHTKCAGVNASYIGGIAGYTSKLELRDCSNSGTIAGNDCVGGLVGKAEGDKTLINCSNTGNVYAFGQTSTTNTNYTKKEVKGKVGLIVGYIYGSVSCVFRNVTVSGNIYVVNDTDYIGGWCGFIENGDFNTIASGISDSTINYKIYLSQNVTSTCKNNYRYGANIFNANGNIGDFNNPTTSPESFIYSESNS